MRELVEKFFVESIEELFGDRHPDMKSAVLGDRKELLINNLTEQLKKIEKKRTTTVNKDGQFRVSLTQSVIKGLVKDFVKLYGQAVIKSKEKEIRVKESQSKIWLPNRGKKSPGIPMRKVSQIIIPRGVKV